MASASLGIATETVAAYSMSLQHVLVTLFLVTVATVKMLSKQTVYRKSPGIPSIIDSSMALVLEVVFMSGPKYNVPDNSPSSVFSFFESGVTAGLASKGVHRLYQRFRSCLVVVRRTPESEGGR